MDDKLRERTVGEIPHVQDIFQLHRGVDLGVDMGAVAFEHLGYAGTHNAKPKDGYIRH